MPFRRTRTGHASGSALQWQRSQTGDAQTLVSLSNAFVSPPGTFTAMSPGGGMSFKPNRTHLEAQRHT